MLVYQRVGSEQDGHFRTCSSFLCSAVSSFLIPCLGMMITSKQHRKMLVKLIIWWGRLRMCVFSTYSNAQKDRSWCNPIKILITYYLRFYRFVLYLSDVMMLSKFLDASSRESRTSGSLAGSPAIQRSLGAFNSIFSILRIMMYLSPKKYVTRAPLSWIKTMVQAVFTIPMGRAVNRPVSLRIGSQGLSRRGQRDRSNQTLVSFPAKNWLVLWNTWKTIFCLFL